MGARPRATKTGPPPACRPAPPRGHRRHAGRSRRACAGAAFHDLCGSVRQALGRDLRPGAHMTGGANALLEQPQPEVIAVQLERAVGLLQAHGGAPALPATKASHGALISASSFQSRHHTSEMRSGATFVHGALDLERGAHAVGRLARQLGDHAGDDDVPAFERGRRARDRAEPRDRHAARHQGEQGEQGEQGNIAGRRPQRNLLHLQPRASHAGQRHRRRAQAPRVGDCVALAGHRRSVGSPRPATLSQRTP